MPKTLNADIYDYLENGGSVYDDIADLSIEDRSQLDHRADDQWPTADDGATWPLIEGGIDYRVIDYTVEVDI